MHLPCYHFIYIILLALLGVWSIIRALAAGSSVGRALSACIAESIGVRVPPRAAPFPLKKVLSWVLLNIIDCCVRGHLYYGSPRLLFIVMSQCLMKN